MRHLLVAAGIISLAMFGCHARSGGTQSGSDILSTGSGSLPAVVPGSKTKLTSAQIDYIADATLKAYDAFYVTGSGYIKTPAGKEVPPSTEINKCVEAGTYTGRWSTLMSLYFAVFPTYTPGFFPAVRECFAFLVSPKTPHSVDGKKPTYPEAYDYCVFMPVDREGNVETGELYNWADVAPEAPPMNVSNKTNGKTIGPMAWIHKNQGDVFQFVMFGGLCGIDTESQQAILDKIAENAPSGSPLAEKRKANDCP